MSAGKFLKAAFVVATSFALATSCIKKPELQAEDGPPAAPEEVQGKLVEAWGQTDSSQIQVGEYVAMDAFRQIASLPEIYLLQDSKLVKQIGDSEDHSSWLVKFEHQVVEDPTGAHKPSNGEILQAFPKTMLVEPPPAVESGSTDAARAMGAPTIPYSIQYMLYAFTACTTEGGSCHNLKTWQETVPPPRAVVARDGCEGLPNCKWTVRAVSFDYVFDAKNPKTGEMERHRNRFLIKMSHEAPYLSRVVEFCESFLADLNDGGKVRVNDCFALRDFRRSAPRP